MNKYMITFAKDNGETFKVAFIGNSEKEAVFRCTNQLAEAGVIGVTAVKVELVEVSD